MNHSPLSSGRHMVGGTIRIFLADALILPTGFITAVFLARRLGPEDYGLFALAALLISWIEWSGISLFASATIKFTSEADDWRDVGTSVARLSLFVSVASAALLWLLAEPIAHLLGEEVMAAYLKLFAIDIPIFNMATTNQNILVGLGSFKERSYARSLRWVARLFLIVLLVEMGLSVNGAILGSIGASAAELVLTRLWVRPSFLGMSRFPLRRLFGHAVPLFLSRMSLRLLRLDLFVLKALGAAASTAGFYVAAQNLTMAPSIFGGSVAQPLTATLSRLIREGREQRARNMALVSLRSVLWLVPLAAMTWGASGEIILLVFGRKFTPAAPILSLLIFAALGLVMTHVVRAILSATGHPGWTLKTTGPLPFIAVAGHLILIPKMGAQGAALVTTLVALMAAAASLWAAYRIWGIVPGKGTFLKTLIISVIAFSLAKLWPAAGLVLVIKILAVTMMVALCFLVSGEFSEAEVALVRSFFRAKAEVQDPE